VVCHVFAKGVKSASPEGLGFEQRFGHYDVPFALDNPLRPAQVGLAPKQAFTAITNLNRARQFRSTAAGKTIFLIGDVYTTGAPIPMISGKNLLKFELNVEV
jgi:hypothetical protein